MLAAAAADMQGVRIVSCHGSKNFNPQKNYILNIIVNNKNIYIKNVQLFLNVSINNIYKLQCKQWLEAPKVVEATQLLAYYKEDSRIFSRFLKNLNFFLSQLSSSWETQACSAAFVIFLLKKCYPQNTAAFRTTEAAFKILKKFFWGGRNELFSPGLHKNVTMLDYKNMYNNLLLGYFPVGEPTIIECPPNMQEPGFYYIKVESNLERPLLPQRKSSRVVFENGIFEGLFWIEEIQLFEELGGKILKIEYALVYPRLEACLADFGNFCLKKRNCGEPLEKLIYKNLANQAFGLFGSHGKFNEQHWNIAISVVVASRARILWYKQSTIFLSKKPSKIVYADTDSFFIVNASQEINVDPAIFNIEKYSVIIFFGKKKYIALKHSGEVRRAGVASNVNIQEAAALSYSFM